MLCYENGMIGLKSGAGLCTMSTKTEMQESVCVFPGESADRRGWIC